MDLKEAHARIEQLESGAEEWTKLDEDEDEATSYLLEKIAGHQTADVVKTKEEQLKEARKRHMATTADAISATAALAETQKKVDRLLAEEGGGKP